VVDGEKATGILLDTLPPPNNIYLIDTKYTVKKINIILDIEKLWLHKLYLTYLRYNKHNVTKSITYTILKHLKLTKIGGVLFTLTRHTVNRLVSTVIGTTHNILDFMLWIVMKSRMDLVQPSISIVVTRKKADKRILQAEENLRCN